MAKYELEVRCVETLSSMLPDVSAWKLARLLAHRRVCITANDVTTSENEFLSQVRRLGVTLTAEQEQRIRAVVHMAKAATFYTNYSRIRRHRQHLKLAEQAA